MSSCSTQVTARRGGHSTRFCAQSSRPAHLWGSRLAGSEKGFEPNTVRTYLNGSSVPTYGFALTVSLLASPIAKRFLQSSHSFPASMSSYQTPDEGACPHIVRVPIASVEFFPSWRGLSRQPRLLDNRARCHRSEPIFRGVRPKRFEPQPSDVIDSSGFVPACAFTSIAAQPDTCLRVRRRLP